MPNAALGMALFAWVSLVGGTLYALIFASSQVAAHSVVSPSVYLGVGLAAGSVVMSLYCIVTSPKVKTSFWALGIGILFFAAFALVWMGVGWRVS